MGKHSCFDARVGTLASKSYLPAELRARIRTVSENLETPSFVRAVLLALVQSTNAECPFAPLGDLQSYLGTHYRLWLSERTIKRAVSWLVDHDVPVGATRNGSGYFFVVTTAQREIAVKPILAQAKAMLARASRLSPNRSYFRRLAGQLEVKL